MSSLQSYKVLVFGAGAIGGYFGAVLAEAGNDVTFVGRGKRLAAMQENGLTLKSFEGGVWHVKVKAAGTPVEKYDIIMLTVKSGDTEEACRQCVDFLNENGVLISMQNGTENLNIIRKYFNEDNVIGGVVNSGISVPEPGIIEYRADPRVTLGGISENGRKKAEEITSFFCAAGINASAADNINEKIWNKLIWNIAFNPLSALLNATCGDLVDNPHTKWVMEQIAEEVLSVAELNGVYLNKDVIDNTLAPNILYNNYKTSSLQDAEANRVPEIEGIMGGVVHSGVDTPFSKAVYELCMYKFSRWFHTFPSLAADVAVINSENEILLIERKNPPFGWALPGGMVDYNEKVETAAVRELEEETGINVSIDSLELVGVYSDPSRDSRGHTVGVVYCVRGDFPNPKAADDAIDAKYFNVKSLPLMAFDHRQIVEDIIKKHNLL